MLQHAADAAMAVERIRSVLVSTDDAGIARAALELGVEVPALRPAELARDESAMIGVIRHAISMAESGGNWVEAVIVLQPTSPFRSASQIDEAIVRYEASGADTLVSVRGASEHPHYAWRQEGDRLVPFSSRQHLQMVRQELPAAFVENGAIFIVSRRDLDRGEFYGEKIVPFEMDDRSSLDIDTPQDLAFAEFLLSGQRIPREV